jgi:CubicO group peptidase (beta-lactamase class C family)
VAAIDPPKRPVRDPYDVSDYTRFSDTTEFQIDSFFRRMYRWGIFNGTYLFHKNDSLCYGAMGYATFSQLDSLKPADLFQLASVSKTFTGTAMMLLVQDGYLKLSDSVHWYIPEFTRRNLSIQNLISHSSGLPDYFYFNMKAWENPKDHLTNDDVVQLLNAQPVNHFAKPGRYDYCNSNYALLALIVERQTGMDFREFVKVRIMNPSGMKYSHLANFDSLGLVNYTVQGYDKKRVFADNIYNGAMGDKGVYSNVFEMLALDRMLRTDYLLHPDAKNQMLAPQTVVSADAFYANGWRVKWINGQKWAFHNGWWKGFRTYYWRCLDENKCFVVLTNNVQGPFLRTIDMVGLLK